MPAINAERVLRDLRHLRTMGAYRTGVHRPALSREHVQSMHWLKSELDQLGYETVVDGIGNVVGRAPGDGPRMLGGSHLESQNYAGWLDGPLGVVYALEAARAVKADAALAGAAMDVAAWCDEEGHFGIFLGSRSAIGKVSEADIDGAVDRTTGRSMRDALKAAGLEGRPRVVLDAKRYRGFLEAHIEQGDWLEAHNLKIGVVTSIVGNRQFKIVFEGVQNHAGTTRMAIRKDAGVACARFAVAIDETFPKVCGPRTVWTTGRITLEPGAPSIIPGRAEMLFQYRDDQLSVLDRLEESLLDLVAKANSAGPCKVSVEVMRRSVPAVMAPSFQQAVEAAAEPRVPGLVTRMPSGAGHDAQILSEVMPAGMMFVPSIGGISHHWTENTSDEDIVLGASVYADAVGRLLKT
ncbi:MAG: Zn-dependent hydrolase [Hyphomicrobiaceae bacterium]|nr:Zn-dependent hydrolase [Hyphomicrobiaceae bacterium]